MKALTLTAVSALALTTAACGQAAGGGAAVTGKLDCPDQQGELRRVSQAMDGKSCVYRISDGAEVTLKLIPVGAQGPDMTLAQIEAELKAEASGPSTASADMPAPAKDAASLADKAVAEAKADAAGGDDVASDAENDASRAARDADREARRADREARHADRDARHADRDTRRAQRDLDQSIEDQVNAKLREKGIDVGGDNDEHAKIDLPGLHINADSDKADVHVGPIHVDASGDTATVRSLQDVRMRGEAFSRQKRGIRAMFVYAGDELGGGYKYVGYEASGPRTGPLAVAVVKSKTEGGFHGDIYGDVKRLVRRNGGT
jgi:hypothetical protein